MYVPRFYGKNNYGNPTALNLLAKRSGSSHYAAMQLKIWNVPTTHYGPSNSYLMLYVTLYGEKPSKTQEVEMLESSIETRMQMSQEFLCIS